MRFQARALLAAPLLAIILSPVHAEGLTAETMSQQQKYSYIQGYGLAQKLKDAKLDLDADAFTQAVKEGLTGKPSALNPEQMKAVVEEQKKILTAEADAASKANGDKGKAYLAENKKKEGVKELLSGVQYKVLKAGEGKAATAKDTVTIHYEGKLIDGTVFDSSYERGEPATFGVAQVVPGFSDALQNMKEGDTWQVVIPAHLAYGEKGAGDKIGPNETLTFKIELIAVK